MKLATYVIGQGDTLEILAQKLLGDLTQVETLITINKLRYPYISDRPIDQYAYAKGTVLLVGSYTNPSSITINNINDVPIQSNDVVFLSEGTQYATGIVQSVSGSTITFTTAITGTFHSGAVVTVFPDQTNVATQVLKTGDTLLYPYQQDVSNQTANDSYQLLLGTDFLLDANGFLTRSNNDIATVSGLDNLAQALRLRFQTYIGGLMLHPDYGNGLFNDLGEANTPYFSGLAKHHLQECALQDARVQKCTITDLTLQTDSIFVVLEVIPIGTQDPIQMSINIPIGGVK
jgi:hypothetical protein